MGLGRNLKQVRDDKPSSTLPDSALIYSFLAPFGASSDTAISYSELRDQLGEELGASVYAKDGVLLAATSNIDGAYENGTLGVGATISDNDVAGFLEIDSVFAPVGERVLLAGQASQAHNGIYIVTANTGSSYILTRATDFDTASKISVGAYTAVAQGTSNSAKVFVESTIGPFVIGTSAITFIDNESGGDIVGPSSANDNAMAVYNGTTGKIVKNSKVYATSAGVVISNAITTPYTTTATMTAAAIVGGIIKLTPVDGSQFFSFDTAANLYAAMGSPVLNSTVKCKIINYSTLHSTLIDITDIAMSGFGMPSFLMAPGDSFDLEGVVTSLAPLHIDWSGGQLQGTLAAQDANDVDISGGEIDGTEIGTNNPSTAKFTSVVTGLATTPSIAASEMYPDLSGNNLRLNWKDSGGSSHNVVLPESIPGEIPRSFSATQSSAQTIPQATNTKLIFDTVLFNIGSYYDGVTNYRFTPPAGQYIFVLSAAIDAPVQNSTVIAYIFKNGTLFKGSEESVQLGLYNPADVIAIDNANGTDYYEAFINVNEVTAGGGLINNLPEFTYFQATLVSDQQMQVDSIVTVSGTSKTFSLSDANTIQDCTNGSAVTLTVPLNSSVAFPIGTSIQVLQSGAGQVSIAATGGVTFTSEVGTAPKIAVQYSRLVMTKLATNTWNIAGRLSA